MALTKLQREICRLLAEHRIRSGESYVAGGVALNELLGTSRLSRDIDLFHDTEEALEASWSADRIRLEEAGYTVQVLRERPSFIEAEVIADADAVRMEWARDSAFRFFPLLQHAELGLVLHPFDLATNKLLALLGRREARDWVDLVECDRGVQPLGYLAWAACGKDPGFSPQAILDHAARSGRFATEEIGELAFVDTPPDVADLADRWHRALDLGRAVISELPADEVGRCVLGDDDALCRLDPGELRRALCAGEVRFHRGSIGGVLPTVRSS